MIFNSFQFLWLFPVVFTVYNLVNSIKSVGGVSVVSSKWSNYLLIIISDGLYMQWNPIYALVLLWMTAVTFLGALSIGKYPRQKIKLVLYMQYH